VLVDDLVSTGGTMAKCVELVRRRGAEKVVVACIHGLFIGDAAEKIQRAGASMIVATDTIPNPYVLASVAGLISSHLT
jgi:ribose-phosphate pyrophosphokinase